jgi:transposase InsO family protein
VALDTVEIFINGIRRYIITFEDIYTRFGFAWSTKSHASLAAKEFFELCRRAFPCAFNFLYVLTDNGSEFKKHFAEELKRLHLTHYHTYPKTPKMNAHVERFNKTIQQDFINFRYQLLKDDIDEFNRQLMDWLIWYNTRRVHYAFQNKMSPVQFMVSYQQSVPVKNALESRIGCGYTAGAKDEIHR